MANREQVSEDKKRIGIELIQNQWRRLIERDSNGGF